MFVVQPKIILSVPGARIARRVIGSSFGSFSRHLFERASIMGFLWSQMQNLISPKDIEKLLVTRRLGSEKVDSPMITMDA